MSQQFWVRALTLLWDSKAEVERQPGDVYDASHVPEAMRQTMIDARWFEVADAPATDADASVSKKGK